MLWYCWNKWCSRWPVAKRPHRMFHFFGVYFIFLSLYATWPAAAEGATTNRIPLHDQVNTRSTWMPPGSLIRVSIITHSAGSGGSSNHCVVHTERSSYDYNTNLNKILRSFFFYIVVKWIHRNIFIRSSFCVISNWWRRSGFFIYPPYENQLSYKLVYNLDERVDLTEKKKR